MSSNKTIRELMEKKYGKKCMVEAAGIRFISKETRKKIKGYKKTQEQLTYHHIKEKQEGGKATEENGAVVKGYNHTWIHSLPPEEKEKVNQRLQQYKLNFTNLHGDGTIEDGQSIILDFDMTDCITILVYDNTKEDNEKRKFNRAKIKQDTARQIQDYYEGIDLDEI